MLKLKSPFNVIQHFIGKGNTETIVVEYSPDQTDIIPRVRGQWVQLPNGNIQVTYTREEYQYCQKLVSALEDL